MKQKERVAITTTSFGEYDDAPLRILEEKEFDVVLNPHKRRMGKDEVVELCRDAIGIIAGTESLDAEVINRLINLRVISRCGRGLDNVDQNAAKERGIKVFNTPYAPTLAVAELTVGLILNILRKVNSMHIALAKGEWKKEMGSLLHGKKVGIIGFGSIGRKIAELLKPFGCEIVYADPFIEDGILGLKRVHIDELLGMCDIISVNVSGEEAVLNEDRLRGVKRGAWLINTSRGGAVNEAALYRALESGHLRGAAIDVFKDEPYKGPLVNLRNVILTPHIGSYAKEARVGMELESVHNLLKGLEV